MFTITIHPRIPDIFKGNKKVTQMLLNNMKREIVQYVSDYECIEVREVEDEI